MIEVTPQDLLTLAPLTLLLMAIVEGIKRIGNLTDDQVKRFGPAIAPVIGIVLTLGASFWLQVNQSIPADPGQATITGLVAGLIATGVYDVAGQQIGTLVDKVSGGRVT